MTIELLCRSCSAPFDADHTALLRGERQCPTCREADIPPIAPCVVTWSERSAFWSVVVPACPRCQRTHQHGGGSGPKPDLGHRNAHCVTGSGSYELVETPASVEARARTRAEGKAA
jgi:hypothetical protein